MDYVCRQCARRARSIATASKHAPARRAFSNTPSRARGSSVPSFPETSSSELNNILTTLRHDHFVPAYLSRTQQHLIFRDRYKSQVENSDSTVTLGDEDFPLRPLDSQALQRSRNDVVKQALDLIVSEKEWRQLMPLLEGLAVVGNVNVDELLQDTIRHASLRGHLGAVIQCLKASKRTGLTLKNKIVLRAVIRGLRQTAERSRWTYDSVQSAIKHAEQVRLLLLRDEHVATYHERQRWKKYVDVSPNRDPFVIAALLELRAVFDYKYGDGEDVEGAVESYYRKLVANIKSENLPEAIEDRAMDVNGDFFRLLSVWQGTRLAEKLLGKKLGQDAKEATDFVNECGGKLARIVKGLEAKEQKELTRDERIAVYEYAQAKKYVDSKEKFEPYEHKEKVKKVKAGTAEQSEDAQKGDVAEAKAAT